MAEEEVGLRLSLKDRAATARGLAATERDLERVGKSVGTTGRLARTSARDFDALDRSSRLAANGAKLAFGGAVAAGYVAARIGKASLTQASDLNESLNAVNVSYERQAGAVKKLGRQAATSIGLSNVEFNGLAVRFSSFSKTIAGKGGPAVVKTLDTLTTRAGDFASVMNLEVADAAELFQSGLAGETEPLRKYGIDLSAAKVQTYAYAEGIAAVGTDLTEAQKIQARYGTLMQQTSNAQGDFKNTSGELANQQRILSARFENAEAKLGKALLPTAQTVVRWLNREGIPAFETFSTWFTNDGIPAIGRFARKVEPLGRELLPAVGSSLGIVRDALSDAAPYARDMVAAFNDMPKWAQTALIGGGIGTAVVKKTGAGSAAAVAARAATGVAKATRVFETNPLALSGPGGPAVPAVVGTLGKIAASFGMGVTGAAGFFGGAALGNLIDTATGANKPSKSTDLQAGLASYGAGAGDPAGVGKTIGSDIANLNSSLGQATNSVFGFLPGKTHINIAEDNIKPIDAALAGLVNSGNVLAAEKAMGKFYTAAAGKGVGNQGEVTKLFPQYAQALGGVAAVTTTVQGKFDNLDRTQMRPKLTTVGFPDAQSKADTLNGSLRAFGGDTFTARADVDTTAAYAKLSALRASAKMSANPELAGARANGGPVTKGLSYLVGERGPEVMVPHTNGRILPRVPAMTRMPAVPPVDPRGFDIDDDQVSGGGGGMVAKVYLDRREIAEAVFEHAHDRVARG